MKNQYYLSQFFNLILYYYMIVCIGTHIEKSTHFSQVIYADFRVYIYVHLKVGYFDYKFILSCLY